MRPPTTLDALLVVAVFSRHATALEFARRRLTEIFGPIGLSGDPFSFHHTAYYAASMGSNLLKQILVFRELVPLDSLADRKRETIKLEHELKQGLQFAEERPINIDPGLLTLGKFMLATTKDQAHRIYLRDAIFAEVTLRYQEGAWEPWPWTYADYREPSVREFLNKARDYYKQRLRETATI